MLQPVVILFPPDNFLRFRHTFPVASCGVGGWRTTVDARIGILLRIIEERGGMLPLSSEQIGGLLGLGEARVLRLFSAEVGKTLRQHLLEVRMARAARSLAESVLPIKKIASDCGYTVVSNFYRDFKKVYGMSPMQTRLAQLNRRLRDRRLDLGWTGVGGESVHLAKSPGAPNPDVRLPA
jgi:AraC-like DNA-binding protein